jgi:hypothetical protein
LCCTTPRITRKHRNLDELPREAALVRDARRIQGSARRAAASRFVDVMSVGQPTAQISIIKKVFYHD